MSSDRRIKLHFGNDIRRFLLNDVRSLEDLLNQVVSFHGQGEYDISVGNNIMIENDEDFQKAINELDPKSGNLSSSLRFFVFRKHPDFLSSLSSSKEEEEEGWEVLTTPTAPIITEEEEKKDIIAEEEEKKEPRGGISFNSSFSEIVREPSSYNTSIHSPEPYAQPDDGQQFSESGVSSSPIHDPACSVSSSSSIHVTESSIPSAPLEEESYKSDTDDDVEAPPPQSLYDSQLVSLVEMGFEDMDKNVGILRNHSGNLDQAVATLLAQG